MNFCYSIAVVLFALAWLVPNHYLPWTSFHSESLIFGAMFWCGLGQLLRKRIQGQHLLIWAMIGLVLGVIGLQWQAGLVLFESEVWIAGLYLVGLGLAVSWGATWPPMTAAGRNHFGLLAAWLVLAAVLSTYIAALQWLNIEDSIGMLSVERGPGTRPTSNLGQPNLFGTLLVMAVVASYGLYRYQQLRGWLLLPIALILSFGIILSESRAALVSVLAVVAYLLWAEWRAGRIVPWRWALAWLAILWGLRSLHAFSAASEGLGLDTPRTLSFGSDSVRMILWRQTMEAILQSPWYGYGWRATGAAQRVGAEVVPGPVSTDYAHNLGLDLLAWFGLPLGLFLLGLGLLFLLRLVWRVREPVEVLLLASTVPFWVHSQLEFPFAYAFFLFPMAWVLGALSSRGGAMPAVPLPSIKPLVISASLGLVFIGWSALAAWVAWEYLEVEEANRVMRFEIRKVGKRPDGFVDPQLRVLDQFDAVLHMGLWVPSRGMSAGELESVRRTNLQFNWGALHRKYIVALALNSQAGEALHQLRVMGNVYGRATYEEELRALRDMAVDSYPELNEVLRRAPPPEGFYDNRIPAPEPALKPPQSRPTSLPASPAGARP
ncbi:Wzy polymerase domain-containing protein [Curvibacter sp. RS43]|uniref:PglL family O-oligosaccharyltransferase n=1 Tax=Curvibacter microcysteis TaxID=3026419 RepID=UPI0023629A05|nr:O-antigen ligase family protein [Curvibacter sp. RS43]MDD0810930.1 Wzy polymerase domain-containing protein [Curvibacter sp. RS43]